MANGREKGVVAGASYRRHSVGYSVKHHLLGPPLINEQLAEERLSRPLALGVLSCDGISSAAYGTEEMLIELLPAFGVAGFALILPMTGVVLIGIALVVLLYREVVSVYTRAGGSYVVARENFGPRIAQVAAVALLIDYIVTVAVQTAAGSAAIVSAFPQLGTIPVIGPKITLIISVVAVLTMCYANLRGVREAGRTFALPTYLFSGSVALMIVVGVVREAAGGLPMAHPAQPGPGGTVGIGHGYSALLTFGAIYILARAFANGGSSLTGIEAVSNAVSALRMPEGRNARQVLVIQGSIVAFLIAGISWMAHLTHATPYTSGYPTVLAQEAGLIFGHSLPGQVLFFAVQAGTAAILFTGGNTSFSGFPFLASFVAEDSFLPRWLTKRGHRLVFSNGIIVLTVVSLTLLIAVGAVVNNLIPFYAIGVFTGFAMAGFGMARYHRQNKGLGWRRHRAISLLGAAYTALVVVIFAVAKFTEGAWLIVIVFPVLVYAFIRLNREYRMESQVLAGIGGKKRPADPHTYARRTVYVLVDAFDLATLAALRYARSLRPTTLRAVHFVLDGRQADALRRDWLNAETGVALELVDTPDRRIADAAADLVSAEADVAGVGVTVILPRRSYSPIAGRLLHDRTADKIASAISRIPHAAATIVPFDVRGRLEKINERETDTPRPSTGRQDRAAGPAAAAASPDGTAHAPGMRPATTSLRTTTPTGPPELMPIGSITRPRKATVRGRIRSVEVRPVEQSTVLACEIYDSTGQLTVLFYGRSHIPGVECGSHLLVRGMVSMRGKGRMMINPAYELLAVS